MKAAHLVLIFCLLLGLTGFTCARAEIYPKEIIPVVYTTNNNQYLEAAIVSIFSILKNAKSEHFYEFHIFTTEALAQEGPAEKLSKAIEQLSQEYKNCRIKLAPIKECAKTKNLNLKTWGVAGVLRILLPSLLPDSKKIIYLDCDIVAVNDLAELYKRVQLTEDKPLAAVLDIANEQNLKRIRKKFNIQTFVKDEYVNTGLIVMDLEWLRKDNFEERTLKWLEENPHAALPDQDAINIVNKGHIRILSLRHAWPALLEELPLKPLFLIHYLGDSKPWKKPDTQLAKVYFKFLEKSPLNA